MTAPKGGSNPDGIFAGTPVAERVRMYRFLGVGGALIALAGAVLGVLAPFPGASQPWANVALGLAALAMLGFAALVPVMIKHAWIRFGYGFVVVSLAISACAYFFGPQAGLLGAMGYALLTTAASLVLQRRFVVAEILVVAVEYGVVLAIQPGLPRPLTRWLVVMLLTTFMAVLTYSLGQLVARLRGGLEDANTNLERRVSEQVEEMERLGRLRRFLPSAVASAVIGSEDEKLLEPHRREIACVFIDLRGFTRFTSEAEPEEVIDGLGSYHRTAGEVLAKFEATVGPLQGDGMMAYFNDPLPCDDPPGRATEMGLALKPALDAFAATWKARGYDLSYGVGIAVGYATLGVVGFEGRQEYGPVGSVANLASRLCDHAAAGQLLMDQRTYSRVSSAAAAEPLEPIEVKGFSQPVNVVAITDGKPAAANIAGAQEDVN